MTDNLSELVGDREAQEKLGILSVSYSRLTRYQRCGEAFRLQHKVKVETLPGGAAIAGSVVHGIIEEMAIGGWFTQPKYVEEVGAQLFWERFPAALEEEGGKRFINDWGQVDYEGVLWGGRKRAVRDEETGKYVKDPVTGENIKVGENFPWFMAMAPTWIKRAGAILRDDIAQGGVILEANVERRVAAWLDEPGGTLITGIIDLMLVQSKDGSFKIRDWKTGTFTDPLQLANYSWLLRNIEDPDARIEADIGQMIYLRGKTKETWIREYELTQWLPLVPRMFADMVKGVDAGLFQLQPSSWCSSCWVREHCDYGKTLG